MNSWDDIVKLAHDKKMYIESYNTLHTLYVHSPDKRPKWKCDLKKLFYVSDWLHMLVCVNTMYEL